MQKPKWFALLEVLELNKTSYLDSVMRKLEIDVATARAYYKAAGDYVEYSNNSLRITEKGERFKEKLLAENPVNHQNEINDF